VTPAYQKEIALALGSIAVAVLLWWSFAWALTDSFQNLGLTITVGVLAILWCIITPITLFMAGRWWTAAAVAGAAAVAPITAGGFSWGAMGGGVLGGLFALAAWRAFKKGGENMRRFRTGAIFTSGTRLLVTGVILAAAGIALPFLEGKIAQRGIEISPDQVALALRPVQPFLRDIMPSLDSDTDIDTIIDNQIRQQGVDPATLPPEERKRIHQQFSQQFSIPVTGQESLSDVVAGRLNETLGRIAQANALTLALVALVVAFLTLRAIIPILTRILVFGIAAGIWTACRLGLIVPVKQTVEVETLTL
jgi:hypothetical protein